ncbi:MAG: peroxiredoxin [Chloroflexi bacterium]|nr:peroxiredoxin [Chloroflexota bacterium]
MPTIGQLAPDFELLNQDEQTVRLSDYRGQKVIVFVFPKADTPGCNTQACTFRDNFPRIETSNAVVLGISTDKPSDLRRWKESRKLPYDLLSDADHKMLEAWGAYGISPLGLIKLPFARRSVFIIDENGILVDGQVDIKPKESVDRALAAIDTAADTVQ